MESYSQELSPYIFAVAEGTIIGTILRPDYEALWIDLFESKMMRFNRDDIIHKWEGDQSSDMAGTSALWTNMVAFFKTTDLDAADASLAAIKESLNTALNELINTDAAYTSVFAEKISGFSSATEAREWGKKEAASKGAENDSVSAAVGFVGAAIWRFQMRARLHKITLAAKNEKQEHLLSDNLATVVDILKGPKVVEELFPALSWEARMAVHDLLDLEEGDQPLQLLSAKARNRILLQIEGYGGFQITAHHTATELVSSYLGSSGIFLRPLFFNDDPHGNVPPYDAEAVAAVRNTVPYYGRYTFDAGRELAERVLLGWVTPVVSQVSFSRVMEKSFLDSLSPGATSAAKMILYLDWYQGGVSSWYQVRNRDTSGSLMREDAMPDDRIVHGNALKIDTHFRIQDVIACSKLPSDGSINDLAHHTLDFRKNDIVVYKRKHTVGLANIGGFEPKDCQFQMLDTLNTGVQQRRKGLDAVFNGVVKLFQ